MTEPFIVKHYASDERPSIKGNGFDGLDVGEDRQDAEDFVAWVNARLARLAEAERLLREIADDQDDRVSPGLRIAAQQFLATVSASGVEHE